MYADPRDIRKHAYKVVFSDSEKARLDAAAQAAKAQPSTYIHDQIMEAVQQLEAALAAQNSEPNRTAVGAE
ncbi:hypothetical protein [Marinobacter sp. MDS2]|uniref:hypothetical protein n=1 Tax=Marinobacter sp. MDS2 TaxID=3065961 RepID=UPI00273BEEA3|nr:hypothetical protein [Marinobacter sp. MDS2]MDP4546518.1 hypothetical protein [Marinobacter sp. MDS2]